MHRERYEKKFMDSIEGVFNKHIETMASHDVLDSCPTYTGELIFSANSQIIPESIKNQYLENPQEVVFIESSKMYLDTAYLQWNKDWSYRIVYK